MAVVFGLFMLRKSIRFTREIFVFLWVAEVVQEQLCQEVLQRACWQSWRVSANLMKFHCSSWTPLIPCSFPSFLWFPSWPSPTAAQKRTAAASPAAGWVGSGKAKGSRLGLHQIFHTLWRITNPKNPQRGYVVRLKSSHCPSTSQQPKAAGPEPPPGRHQWHTEEHQSANDGAARSTLQWAERKALERIAHLSCSEL